MVLFLTKSVESHANTQLQHDAWCSVTCVRNWFTTIPVKNPHQYKSSINLRYLTTFWNTNITIVTNSLFTGIFYLQLIHVFTISLQNKLMHKVSINYITDQLQPQHTTLRRQSLVICEIVFILYRDQQIFQMSKGHLQVPSHKSEIQSENSNKQQLFYNNTQTPLLSGTFCIGHITHIHFFT